MLLGNNVIFDRFVCNFLAFKQTFTCTAEDTSTLALSLLFDYDTHILSLQVTLCLLSFPVFVLFSFFFGSHKSNIYDLKFLPFQLAQKAKNTFEVSEVSRPALLNTKMFLLCK